MNTLIYKIIKSDGSNEEKPVIFANGAVRLSVSVPMNARKIYFWSQKRPLIVLFYPSEKGRKVYFEMTGKVLGKHEMIFESANSNIIVDVSGLAGETLEFELEIIENDKVNELIRRLADICELSQQKIGELQQSNYMLRAQKDAQINKLRSDYTSLKELFLAKDN